MAGQEQSATPMQAPAPMGQTPLDPDIMKKQQEIIRQQQAQVAPMSHLAQPTVNPKTATAGQFKGLIPIVGGALQDSVKAKKAAEVDKYAAIFGQLDAEWTKAQQLAGGDAKKADDLFKASPTYKAIFNAHDPKAFKTLKEMQQVFIAPWLDDGGESSPAVAGFKRHTQIKGAAEQASMVQRMQQQFDQMRQSQPTESDPKQVQALNETVRSTTGVAREQRAENAPHVQFTKDANGNMVAMDKNTMQAKPIMVDYGKGPEQLKGAATGKNGVLSVGGVPVGIYKNGQPIQPGDPAWTGEDGKHLESYKAAYKTSQDNMTHRAEVSGAARAAAFASYRPVGLMDNDGNLFETTAGFLQKHPGEFAPAAEGVKARNRSAIFDEIKYTSSQVQQSISELPDEPFDAATRAQLAIVLRAEDPKSAWDSFIASTSADTLTDGQIKYVTGLVSLSESGMGLKTVAGLGQGSDMVRGSIQKMLPGPGTPGKAYAQRQMQLFLGEVNALEKKSVPHIGAGPGSSKSSNSPVDIDKTLDSVYGPRK